MTSLQKLIEPSWECVHFVDPEDPWKENLAAAQVDGVVFLEINSADVSSETDLLGLVAEALRFPDYFGLNWDAFEECLRDMSWLPARVYILVIPDAEKLWHVHPRPLGKLVQSWLFCAEEWADEGVAFHLVFSW